MYLALKGSICDSQRGFLMGRSTTSNLIMSHDFISRGMEQHEQVDVVYTDYSKCFDRIDLKVLVQEFTATCFGGFFSCM